MNHLHAIVVGASSGGVAALLEFAAGLPRELRAVVGVVLHVGSRRSLLPELLTSRAALPAIHPRDGEPLAPGTIYVAPPDFHMTFTADQVRLSRAARENHARPAIDPLFRSAALAWRERAIGVVLTGDLDDGTAGLAAIKQCGGTAIVQDPADALMRSMPLNALENVEVDYKLPVAQMAPLLARLVREPAPAPRPVSAEEQQKAQAEIRIAEEQDALEEDVMKFGELSAFTCPECHGVLSSLREGKVLRFRCHTGHAFSANSLLLSTTEQIEERLWDAVRALDETVMLLNNMGQGFARAGNTKAAEQCFDKAREAYQRSQPLREAATSGESLSGDNLRAAGR